MAATRMIQPVMDNRDKQRTYRALLGKYNLAMKHEFYLQAIIIEYAMIEDRLRSMLYHMGFLANRTAHTVFKRTRPYLSEIVSEYKTENENLQLGISNLSGKTKLIRCVMMWTAYAENAAKNDKFLIALKSQCEGMDVGAVLSALEDISKWSGYRNEIVHALMNKNLDSLDAGLKEKAEEGMRLARLLDNQEKVLKSGNRIRKSVNLPMN